MLGKAIKARLTSAQTGDQAAETAALATLTSMLAGRIYPGVSDQDTYPLLTYQIHQENEDSLSPMTAKEFTVTITMTARGQTAYGQTQDLKAAVRALLDRKSSEGGAGSGAGGAWGGVKCKWYLRGSDESNENDQGNPDALFYEVTDEYRVWAQA